jgi:hypothetical protein
MSREIPEPVSSFILEHIFSVAQLELLLWMREQGDQPISADQVARQHRMQPDMALGLLEDLRARKFLEKSPGPDDNYIYRPDREEISEQMEALASFYGQYRYSVINLIFSRPPDSVQSFARSFRVRKEKPDG